MEPVIVKSSVLLLALLPALPLLLAPWWRPGVLRERLVYLAALWLGAALWWLAGSEATLRAGDEDALPIRTNARVLGATLKAGESTEYQFAQGDRYGYLVLAAGRAEVDGVALDARDGAAVHAEKSLRITASEDTEIVLVDAGAVH